MRPMLLGGLQGCRTLPAYGIDRATGALGEFCKALPAEGGAVRVGRRGQDMPHHHEIHFHFAGCLAFGSVMDGSRHHGGLGRHGAAQQQI